MTQHQLAPTYALARQRFVDAAESAGARIDSFPHPMKGLEGEELAIDVAQLGDPAAQSALLVVSGTDGVAGYVGSALQSWWLKERASEISTRAPRVILLHALNPFAFSWVRRVNEDNVDLNRNFIDWSAAPPNNTGYAQIADLLVPSEWSEAVQAYTTGELLAFAGRVGLRATQSIISGGQFTHPAGLFFGGTGPVWSHRWLVEQLPSLVQPVHTLGVIDIQGGLPESGTGMITARRPIEDPGHQRAAAWWAHVDPPHRPDPGADLHGEWLSAIDSILPSVDVTGAALDYSVVDVVTMLQAMRADAWLHNHGDPTAPEADVIRQRMREAFTDEDPEWLPAVTAYFDEVTGAAITALTT